MNLPVLQTGFLLQGAPLPPSKTTLKKIFIKTIEITIGTIAHCIKNNGLLSSPRKFFPAESQASKLTHILEAVYSPLPTELLIPDHIKVI